MGVECCCEEDGEERCCDDTALFDPSLHTCWVYGGSAGEHHGLHDMVEQAENGDEFLWAAKYEENVPQSLTVDRVEDLCEIEEGQRLMLLPALFLDLDHAEDHVHCAS